MATGPPQYQKEMETMAEQIRVLTMELERLKSPENQMHKNAHNQSTRSTVVPSRRVRGQCWVWSLRTFSAGLLFES